MKGNTFDNVGFVDIGVAKGLVVGPNEGWISSNVSINYRKDVTNLHAEVMSKFITSEAGVTLSPPTCETHSRSLKECEECAIISSGHQIEESISVEPQPDGTNKLVAELQYTNPIFKTFFLKLPIITKLEPQPPVWLPNLSGMARRRSGSTGRK